MQIVISGSPSNREWGCAMGVYSRHRANRSAADSAPPHVHDTPSSAPDGSVALCAIVCWGGECGVIINKVADLAPEVDPSRTEGLLRWGSAQPRGVDGGQRDLRRGSGRRLLDNDSETNIRDCCCTQRQSPGRRGVPGQLLKAP